MNDSKPTVVQNSYEYAGFRYTVVRTANGVMRAIPEAGQHASANKEKHCMAAIDCWRQEQT